MSFYNGSKWNEDATEIDPVLNKLASEIAKRLKGKGGQVIKERDMADRFEEADRIQARLGFRLNRSPYKRRR